MAKGPRYKVPKRRRREGKTNYYKRYIMVLSRRLRLVVRRTLKYVIAQLVAFSPEGDKTLVAAHSRELIKRYGWKASGDNTPAAYLTGYLLGLRAIKAGYKEAIADIGLHRPTRGARVFAVVKGAIDAGMKIPVGEEVIPDDDRIKGVHIASYADFLERNDPERYQRMFSGYLSVGLRPQDLPEHFEEVKGRIEAEFAEVVGDGSGAEKR